LIVLFSSFAFLRSALTKVSGSCRLTDTSSLREKDEIGDSYRQRPRYLLGAGAAGARRAALTRQRKFDKKSLYKEVIQL
jgi:hypothetical protein